MSHQNTSDMIEAYLKKILEESEMIEIRRAEMADLFNCVPSQINYVINTRFTVQRGYTVESKRGGGGYIRIEKVQISNYHQFLEQVNQLFDQSLSEKDGIAIIQKLYEEGILSKREGNLLLVTISKVALGKSVKEENIRANIMHGVLERLSYEL
ncbi:CtsR family transcriptional regulator [Tetragenococcus halophilus]|uniref:Transcriptional regulator CtsR n=2 Tax=Tetragenococcus halophilus TaxID=51669 RepID=A0A2H6DU79_TETHA|nr:CtsR family transcriptional regulator [Tetragenococcus halophilus]AOF47992.1 CtsR family transcriptional regulator [Tetragenococcus halophilus]MCF1684493.1 CtsR family transcriptional regulator [Tetragenococcus halophilus]MCO7025886.1 CtsR family transcriptional regulator [Tetragenococcus halophilus]MCO8283515.1 CtsR family transcriptional regulator [Tetragenococcus halophilus]MCO8293381.1 CtsR family transcriptional regulator [Tetragenococcus halophilus]